MSVYGPLVVELCDDSRQWRLVEPLSWRDPDGVLREVPAGFVSDFASVPRLMRPFALDDAATAKAAVFHDYAYRVALPGRRWADDLFYHQLRGNGVPVLFAWCYWLGVRLFGWIAYDRSRQNG